MECSLNHYLSCMFIIADKTVYSRAHIVRKSVKSHLILLRVVILVELDPIRTGKSDVSKELSPNSILVSGGQRTVAYLF